MVGLRSLTVALVLLSLPAPATAQNPVIDVHMHALTAAQRDRAGVPMDPPCAPAGCLPFSTIVREDADVMRLALDAMDRNNIVLGVISGMQLGAGDDLRSWLSSSPGRFLAGSGFFNPVSADTAFLREGLSSGRIKVIGEIGSQYRGYAPDDEALEPFYDLAEEFDVPVLIHMAGIGGSPRGFRIAQGHPERLEEVLIRHPDMRMWVENAGYPFLDEITAVM